MDRPGSSTPADSRARDSVTAAAPFRTRLQTAVGGASSRLVDRYAPEQGGGRGSRALGHLGFADRMLAQYVRRAEQSAGAGRTASSFASSEQSWLFPYPWYQDELDWVQSARMAATRPGGQPGLERRPGRAAAALPLSLIAPTLARSAAVPGVPGAGPAPWSPVIPAMTALGASRPGSAPAVRAWSPLVAPAALRAAEVLAGAVAQSATATPLRSGADVALELVAPAELVDQRTHGLTVARLRSSVEAARVAAQASSPAPAASAPAAGPLAPAGALPPAGSTAPAAPSSPAATASRPAGAGASSPVRPRSAELPTQAPAAGAGAAPTPPPGAPRRSDAATAGAGSASAPGSAGPGMQPVPAAVGLTAIELLARGRDADSIAPAAGPRLAMPVGLGGLVTGLDAARLVSRPLAAGRRLVPAPPAPAEPAGAAASSAPAMIPMAAVWSGPGPGAAREPASLGHITWADRWLARFAGASESSLATLSPRPATTPTPRPLGAFRDAPGEVYVSLDPALPPAAAARASAVSPAGTRIGPAAGAAPTAATRPSTAAAAPPTRQVPPAGAPRMDDNERVPDDVFLAIARAPISRPGAKTTIARPQDAAGPGVAAPSASSGSPASGTVAASAGQRPLGAPVLQRAASAPADRLLRQAPRPLGAGLEPSLGASPVASVLSGALGQSARPVFDPRFLSPAAIAAAAAAGVIITGRWSPAAVGPPAPGLLGGLAGAAPLLDVITPSGGPAAPVRQTPARSAAADAMSNLVAEPPDGSAERPSSAPPATPSQPSEPAFQPGPGRPAERAVPAAAGRAIAGAGEPLLAPGIFPAGAAMPAAARGAGFSARPGAMAASAAQWSADQEQGVADLAFDFVTPELILAARAYGFGPIEAAQAARMATAGQGGLAAMSAAIDLTFVRAAQNDAVRTAAVQRSAVAAGAAAPWTQPAGQPLPASAPAPAVAGMATATGPAPVDTGFQGSSAPATAGWLPAMVGPRRMPRGAFLWPQASLDSLEVGPLSAGHENPLALAALDLIAAHVVAEAGARAMNPEAAEAGTAGASMTAGPAGGASFPASPGAAPVARDAARQAGLPAALPAEFEPIYLALSRSPAGRSLSPTVRAARALVLAQQATRGRADSARARAAAAWAVMPMVLTGGEEPGPDGAPAAAEASPAARAAAAAIAGLPFLQLSAGRAGESLQSLVAPTSGSAAPAASAGMAARAPTAAPELVRTGPTGRVPQATGAGEETVPPWFEDAARRMFDQQSDGEGMSLAEMTLVTAAPARHVAASAASANRSATPAPAQGAGGGAAEAAAPDIEELAEELFGELQRLMDIALERSGDPWQT